MAIGGTMAQRDSNNDLRTAKRLGANPFRVVTREQIGLGDRNDFYQFRLTRASSLNVSLRRYSGNATVELLDDRGSRVQRVNFPGTGIDVLLSGSLAPGRYYLRVFNRRTTAPYRLRVNAIEDLENGGVNPQPSETTLFRNINPGGLGSDPSDLIVVGNFLYFAADNGFNGRELFRTTGRGDNLTRIDINLRSIGASSDPRDLVNINGTLYFSATDGFNGRELFRITGNARTASLVTDLNPGEDDSNPDGLINFNNVLYFTADSGNGQGRELYRSNGTRNSTELVADINPGAASSNPTDFAVVNNVLYFAADNGFNGRELFSNNGTIGNVNLVADLNFGRTDGLADSSIPTDLINVNNVLYFAATSQLDGREVWRYDPLADANTPPAVISNLSNATTGSSPGTDLSALPGSDPAVLENFLADRPNRSAFAAIDNGLYFAATSEVLGRELYRTDGTFASTALVNNINPNGSSDPTGLTNINGVLYFGATASTLFGKELYRFNPSARRPRARLVRVSDINPGEGGSEPTEFVQFRNNLIFVATTPFFGQELRSLPLRA